MAAIVVAGAGVHGGQARQPGGLLRLRHRRPAGAPRHPARPRPGRGGAHCVTEAGIGFCFAARFHPGMRHAAVPRRELGVPTVFNFLGPLTNPARPRPAAVGCFDLRMAPVMAEVFARRGDSRAGDARRGRPGRVHHRRADPGLGGPRRQGRRRPWSTRPTSACPAAPPGDLRGGDAAFNADVARRLFAGEPGPVRDAVLVNAAAALAAQAGFPGDLARRAAGRHGPGRRDGRLRRRRGHAGPLGGRRQGRQGRRAVLSRTTRRAGRAAAMPRHT